MIESEETPFHQTLKITNTIEYMTKKQPFLERHTLQPSKCCARDRSGFDSKPQAALDSLIGAAHETVFACRCPRRVSCHFSLPLALDLVEPSTVRSVPSKSDHNKESVCSRRVPHRGKRLVDVCKCLGLCTCKCKYVHLSTCPSLSACNAGRRGHWWCVVMSDDPRGPFEPATRCEKHEHRTPQLRVALYKAPAIAQGLDDAWRDSWCETNLPTRSKLSLLGAGAGGAHQGESQAEASQGCAHPLCPACEPLAGRWALSRGALPHAVPPWPLQILRPELSAVSPQAGCVEPSTVFQLQTPAQACMPCACCEMETTVSCAGDMGEQWNE
jgi:hypothetical protein